MEYETEELLTDEEREVILGVHKRSYKNGQLAKDPSPMDFQALNDAYKRKFIDGFSFCLAFSWNPDTSPFHAI